MKFLRRYIDSIKPRFKKGGKLEKLSATFDAFETFLFVPDKVTRSGAHIRDSLDMKHTSSKFKVAIGVIQWTKCCFNSLPFGTRKNEFGRFRNGREIVKLFIYLLKFSDSIYKWYERMTS